MTHRTKSQPTVEVCYHTTPEGGVFTLPSDYEPPPAGRLASTPGDNLCEFAGKLCYDSLNKEKSRASAEYHKHILETKHYSVYGHIVDTYQVEYSTTESGFSVLAALHNRPGVWVTEVHGTYCRFAASLRAVLEWDDHGVPWPTLYAIPAVAGRIRDAVQQGCAARYPLAAGHLRAEVPYAGYDVGAVADRRHDGEKWVSLYIAGVSRRLLQDLVRHHWQANPSVRSTRYCDEGDSLHVINPTFDAHKELRDAVVTAADDAMVDYRYARDELLRAGVDRKTALGAAGNLLPECTETRLVFSLSLFQAKHLLGLRLAENTGKVDAEIKRLAEKMRDVLTASPVSWNV